MLEVVMIVVRFGGDDEQKPNLFIAVYWLGQSILNPHNHDKTPLQTKGE
jgi:hypothetical protein